MPPAAKLSPLCALDELRERVRRAREALGVKEAVVTIHLSDVPVAALRELGLRLHQDKDVSGASYLHAWVEVEGTRLALFSETWRELDAQGALVEARRRWGRDGCVWAEPERQRGLVYHVGVWCSDDLRETHGEGATWEAAFVDVDARGMRS